ncbi:hypothetical protein RZS08_59205, partial [Arthrospira platensis SPKY1]|nr:hypothetical protein [Arthrospira platensis SPKY1]
MKQFFNYRLLLWADSGNHKVLVTCQAEIPGVHFGDLPQAGFHFVLRRIQNTTVLNKQSQMP